MQQRRLAQPVGVLRDARPRGRALARAWRSGWRASRRSPPFSLFGTEQGLGPRGATSCGTTGSCTSPTGRACSTAAARHGGPPQFSTSRGVANQCWAFMEFADPDGKMRPQLLLSASDGLYRIDGTVARGRSSSRRTARSARSSSPRRDSIRIASGSGWPTAWPRCAGPTAAG